MRQVFLAQLLAESGNSLCCYALPSYPKDVLSEESPMIHKAVSLKEACAHSRTVLFPFPFTQNGSDVSVKEDRCRFSIQSVLDLLQPGQAFLPDVFRRISKKPPEKKASLFMIIQTIRLFLYSTALQQQKAQSAKPFFTVRSICIKANVPFSASENADAPSCPL